MAVNKGQDIYKACAGIKRIQPVPKMTEELAKQIGENYRTIPCFEKDFYNHMYKKHYSLGSNELLKCRWKQYKRYFEVREFAPFQFPSARDLHFYNGDVQFLPSQSVFRWGNYRMHLTNGPGVDRYGQMPIPQELLMKRGKADKDDRRRIKKRAHAKK